MDRLTRRHDEMTHQTVYIAECHGAVEETRVSDRDWEDVNAIAPAVAFTMDSKALAAPQEE